MKRREREEGISNKERLAVEGKEKNTMKSEKETNRKEPGGQGKRKKRDKDKY